MSTRKSTDDPFGKPVNLDPPVNTEFREGFPTLSSDSLTLLFYSNRPNGQGDSDLWMSTRKSVDDPFGNPVNLGPVVNTSNWEGSPELSPDCLTLYFSSNRPNGQGEICLWMARIEGPGRVIIPFSSPRHR